MYRRAGPGERDEVFACYSCKVHSCIQCDVPWHEGQTCEQFQENGRQDEEQTARDPLVTEQEELSKEAIKILTRKCPGSGCGVPIMQDKASNGCDKIKCEWKWS